MKAEHSTTLAEANQALVRGDFVAARDLYERLAALGSKGAHLGLAAIYERGGRGVPQDHGKARYWYELALAKTNSAKAALALGHIYCLGLGVPIDYEKAFYYYAKLENHPGAIGLLRLGMLYESGKGVARDIRRARNLYRRASKLGNIRARKNWSVLELKHGNFPLGLLLWLWVIVQGVTLALIDGNNKKLRAF